MASKRTKLRTDGRRRRVKEAPAAENVAAVKMRPEHFIGGKYIRLLKKYMQQLRGESEHGNRQLYLDDVFAA